MDVDDGWRWKENFLNILKEAQEATSPKPNFNSGTELSMIQAARLHQIPIVLHVRNGALEPYNEIIKSADAVIAISEFLKREIFAFPLDPEKIHVIPDEADTDYYRPHGVDKMQIRRELNLPPNAKIALMIARIAPNKRHDLMIEAADLVRKSIPNFHLVIKSGNRARHRIVTSCAR